MTRNDLVKVMKTMILSMACSLPIVLIISFLIADKLSNVAIVFIDSAMLITAGVLGYFVKNAHERRIKRKRAEFLQNQKAQQKGSEK